MARLRKPESVKSNPFKSKKWNELTKDREFDKADIPLLELLCQWHYVVHQCIEDLDDFGSLINVDDNNRVQSWPQLQTMKQASAEIRQLNKQLGINDETKKATTKKATILTMVVSDRANKSRTA